MNKNAYLLTFDVDWAPDCILYPIAERLIENQIKSTWFITHRSPFLEFLRSHQDWFELGIHPNFMANSTQGRDLESVMKHCLSIVPEARSIRTHGTYFSGQFLSYIATQTSIQLDSSTFWPGGQVLSPVVHEVNNTRITRLPVYWIDDYLLHQQKPDWANSTPSTIEGVYVYAFHPIHIFLNSNSLKEYDKFKNEIMDFSNTREHALQKYKQSGIGIKQAYENLIQKLDSQDSTYFMRELIEDPC